MLDSVTRSFMPKLQPTDFPIGLPVTSRAFSQDVDASRRGIWLASTAGDTQQLQRIREHICVLPSNESRLFLEHGLLCAIYVGQLDTARFLMSCGARLSRLPARGAVALNSCKEEIFQLLIDDGWDVNSLEGLDRPVIV